ncbi:MAG TPA: leucine--tRNA ligase [Propionibacteriaceae bacterium]|nr:leucine--tRNA ligase [Propionibacteriaceae bacterium]
MPTHRTHEDEMSTDEPAEVPPHRYSAALANEIEGRWQERWSAEGTFHTPNPTGDLDGPRGGGATIEGLIDRSKVFVLDMFPYPSGAGLHVGHPLGYIGTDVHARFLRMTGHNVLHAMGFDAFGLPAEQYAAQTGQHPRTTTERNVETYRSQLRRLGLAHDERRSVATTDVSFYKWTQWIFLKIFNSWFDPDQRRARPIADLVTELAAGIRPTPHGRPWTELTETEQRSVVDGFRLAYRDEAPVNWCPGLGTVLANEEVTADRRSERGNFPVFTRTLTQWKMRITAYADRLLDDLDRVDWPESVKTMQRNWIGRSVGATIAFPTEAGPLEVFTTRPDTIFGATFMVLAPEHPLADALAPGAWPEGTAPEWTGEHETPAAALAAYRAQAAAVSEADRTAEDRTKTGVFTGGYATNPATGRPIPVFVADYVLMGYGTGAIMAVPGQDQRDWDFAGAYALPIVRTVAPPVDFDGEAYVGAGPAINSANDDVSLNGLSVEHAKARIVGWLETTGRGRRTVIYKLRDWLFSRQRYWGEPFPIVYDETGLPVALPESMLPLELPEIDDYSPRTFDPEDADSEPEPPLGRATEWAEVELDLGNGPQRYRRELSTMPQWAGSCWYEIRYTDPANDERFVDREVERYWLGPRDGGDASTGDPGGVDLYVGGVEHAVLHLLYARFWHKVLYDLGEVSSAEPFRRLFNQGYVQAYAYRDERGIVVPAAEVTDDGKGGYIWQGQPVRREAGKMGKSLKNVVTPDEICEQYGADTFRLYEMSTGPLDADRPWETRAVVGSQRFLQRLWRLVVDERTGDVLIADERPLDAEADGEDSVDAETLSLLHRTIDRVIADYTALRFNTAVARLTELNNRLTALAASGPLPRSLVEPMVLLAAPLVPHVAEELWSRLGHAESLAYQPFPVADPARMVAETVLYPVQVNGKLRGKIEVPADAEAATIEAAALDRVAHSLDGRVPKRVIVVPGRIVTVVV